jgi:hypothetical protein
MKQLEVKSCSRCGETFGCGALSDEEKCWCVQLPPISLNASGASDCFCPRCLREVIRIPDRANNSRRVAPTNATKAGVNSANTIVAGEDYYLEGDAIVFTARYHLRRGYCCESGCRHCPYGAGGK